MLRLRGLEAEFLGPCDYRLKVIRGRLERGDLEPDLRRTHQPVTAPGTHTVPAVTGASPKNGAAMPAVAAMAPSSPGGTLSLVASHGVRWALLAWHEPGI